MFHARQMWRHLLPLIHGTLVDNLRSDILLHVQLALAFSNAQQRLLIPLRYAIDHRLPLVLQCYCIIIISVRVLRVHYHLA